MFSQTIGFLKKEVHSQDPISAQSREMKRTARTIMYWRTMGYKMEFTAKMLWSVRTFLCTPFLSFSLACFLCPSVQNRVGFIMEGAEGTTSTKCCGPQVQFCALQFCALRLLSCSVSSKWSAQPRQKCTLEPYASKWSTQPRCYSLLVHFYALHLSFACFLALSSLKTVNVLADHLMLTLHSIFVSLAFNLSSKWRAQPRKN